ncbi:MAG: hypothetical protein GY711_33565 [bacterium]|nr:hypothetical protein [bacterium]
MADSESKSDITREVQGGALFFISAFPFVLVLFAWIKYLQGDVPGPDARRAALLARGIVDGMGFLPPLIASAGFAGIGAWMLLGGRPVDAGRHLTGVLFTAIGLAVVLGAFSAVQAGSLGAGTGGVLAARLGSWAGVFVGVAVIVLSVYFAWLKDKIDFSGNSGQSATLSDALSEKDSDGVSTAEANALVPDESTLAYMEDLWQAEVPQLEPIPPSPYPEDVRLLGGLPDGTRALSNTDESRPQEQPQAEQLSAEAESTAWRRTSADVEADLPAGEDLAPVPAAAGPQEPAEPTEVRRLVISGGPPEPSADAPADPVALETASDPAPAAVTGGTESSGSVRPIVDEDSGDGPPSPTWEQSPLFEPTDESSTEVDPVELVEPDVEEPTDLEEEEVEVDEEAELEEDEEAELEEGEEGEYEEEEGEYEEYEEGEEEGEEEEGELEEGEEEEEGQGEEEEGEYEEYEEEEGEEEEGEEEEGEYEEEEYEEGAEPEAAELEEGEEEEGEEYEEEEGELEEEEEEDEEAELAEEEVEEDEAEAAELDEPEPEPDEPAAEAEPEPAAESEVVLEPQSPPAPPAAASRRKPSPLSEDRAKLVHDAGVLFLEQGRVAVSLIQRRFSLDFDEACEILDELQEQGLIGPYMGGQRRDILMTLEEWKGRVAQS